MLSQWGYSPRAPLAGNGGASVVSRISQSCAGETFGYAAQVRSQRPQTCRMDAPCYGTRAMQMTNPRDQNYARRAQFRISALYPLAPTPFDEISRNFIQGYLQCNKGFQHMYKLRVNKLGGQNFEFSKNAIFNIFGRIMKTKSKKFQKSKILTP